MQRLLTYTTVVLGILLVSRQAISQPVDICNDPVDAQCQQCVKTVANYSSWMVVPGDGNTAGSLQKAIDESYSDIEKEWTGPVAERTYTRAAYVEAPLAILALLMIALAVQRLVRPQLHVTTAPSWRTEKVALIAVPLLLLFAVGLERWLTHRRFVADYDALRDRAMPFVRIASPRTAVRSTGDPCEFAFGSNAGQVSACRAEQKLSAAERTKSRRFTAPDLLKDYIAVAQTCRTASLPVWWAQPTKEQGLDCVIFGEGAATVQFRDIASVRGFEPWLTAGTGERVPPSLDLSDAFGVAAASGNLYKAKVKDIIGPHERYKRMFVTQSLLPMVPAAAVMITYIAVLWAGRRRELVVGSKRWHTIQLSAHVVAGLVAAAWLSILLINGVFGRGIQ